MGQVTKKNNIINLENKPLDFIGKISYGIYVIHPLVIFLFYKILGHLSDSLLNYVLVYVLVTVTTILISYLSYEYFEKRFLKLKLKYTTIKSSSTRENELTA